MALLKLQPSYKDYIWGGNKLKTDYNKEYSGEVLAESWELSCHKDGPSVIANGAYQGKTLAEYIEIEGMEVLGKNCRRFQEFPILIKFIDAKDNLSIQVHPDNGYALKNEGQYGKTEMWYVTECKEGAFLYYGFKDEVTQEEFQRRIENDTVLEVLNKVPVQKGDVLFIEAGTIHAIGKDIVIAEIQQNSNVTYRVYDYGRVDNEGNQRDLHVGKALAVTNRVPLLRNKSAIPHLAKCDYFTVDKLNLDGNMMKKITGGVSEDSFVSILVLEGHGVIRCKGDDIAFQKGDSLFLTADSGEYEVEGICEALVTTIGEKASPIRIATHISSSGIHLGLYDISQQYIWKVELEVDVNATFEKTIEKIGRTLLQALEALDIRIDNCIGIGAGVPGIIDSENGIVKYSNTMKWENVPFASELQKYIPIPVYMDNNTNCMLSGEHIKGVAKQYKNSAMIRVGNGVGSGIILQGSVFQGGVLGAGELGHMLFRNNGKECTCGRKGCFEAYVSKQAFMMQIKNAMMNHQDSYMWENCKGNLDSVDEYTALQCLEEDYVAQEVWMQYIQYMSEGIVNIINIFRPNLVVIAGFFGKDKGNANRMICEIEHEIQHICFGGNQSYMPRIEVVEMEEEKGLLGAANLI